MGEFAMTFAELDRMAGCPEPVPDPLYDDYPLPTWYREVRNIPIDDLTLYDICLACGQRIHLPHVLPVAIRILETDPIAGDYYEGHLLSSICRVPLDYWESNRTQALRLSNILEVALEKLPTDTSVMNDVHHKLHQLKTAITQVIDGFN